MKKIYIILCLLTNIAFTQVTFENISLPTEVATKNFYSISKQGSILYISGDGCLLKSNNNGDQWSMMYNNSNYFFFDVKFTDSQNGYAVGWPKGADALNKISTLFKTVDGGVNWVLFYSSTRHSSASIRFNEGEMRNGAIDFLDESRLIWGCGTTQFYSATGGRGNHCTVTPIQTYTMSIPNINLAFFGSSGIGGSLTGGVKYGISGFQASDYYDFDLVTPDDLYSVVGGAYNEVIKIKVNQNNTSISKDITGATDRFYGIDFLDLNYGFVVGKNGKIAYTTNACNSFIQVTPFTNEQLNDVLFYTNSSAIVIGNNGTVFRMISTIPTNSEIVPIKPIYNETDINWNTISSGTSSDLYEVEVKNGVTYIAGDGLILKSINAGATFSSVYTDVNYQFRDITFVDASIGWVIGYNISLNRVDVLKTLNGGSSWSLQTSLPGSGPGIITGLVIEAFDANYVLASYADPVNSVKKITNDGGLNWSNVGGNYEVAPISDFIFFGTNYSSSGHQGYGTKRTGGGTYLTTNLDNGAGNNVAGCISLTSSDWIKNYGMNAISAANNHISIARDLFNNATSNCEEGYLERTKIPNPQLASDWACYPTYTPIHYYGVKMMSENEIWLVGEKGTVITTRLAHGGIISETSEPNPQKEWFGHNTGTFNHLFDIESIDNNKMICVGKNGTIIVTSNAQSTAFLANQASVTTDNLTLINATSATCGGNVVFSGSKLVTSRGVCWSTSTLPTTSNFTTTNGSGIGTFTSTLSGLTPSTLYYVRAYATNSVGTSYGNQVTFTTLSDLSLEELNQSNGVINIFPNPTNGFFNVNISDNLIGSKMEILSIDGRVIKHSFLENNKVDIDLSNCNNGVYIIQISNLKTIISTKIVKN